MIQFDLLLEKLGGVGRYQKIVVVILGVGSFLGGINSLIPVFVGYSPDKRCNTSPLGDLNFEPSLTEDELLNYTTPYNGEYNTCQRYGYNLSSCVNGSLSCVDTSYEPIPCDQGYVYDTSVMTSTIVTQFDLVCDRSYLNSLSTSLFYVGMLVGSLTFANISDIFGRKPSMILSCIGVWASMIGVAYANSIELYMIIRIVTAMFGFGMTISTFIYSMEIVQPKYRTLTGMFKQGFFPLGYMVLSGLAYNWRDWNSLLMACAILVIPMMMILMIIPESPRWLFVKNRDKKGKKVVNLMAKVNNVKITDNDFDNADIISKVDLLAAEDQKRYTTFDLFRHPGLRLLTIKNSFVWFVNSLVYYGISLNAGALAGDLFINNTLNGVFELASYVLVVLVMDKIGRRVLLSAMLLLAGVGMLCSVVTMEYAGDNESLLVVSTIFAFVGKFGISGSFGIVFNFTAELYPTVLRSNGIGLPSFVSRIGGILAPFIISIQNYVSWLPNTLFGVLGIAGCLVAWTFPETNGNRMMETIEEAEEFYRTKIIRKNNDHHVDIKYITKL